MHPNSNVSVYPLERLTKLYDGIEQLEDDGWAEDTSDDDESADEENGEGVWLKDDEGVWRYRFEQEPDADEWEDDEERGEGDNNEVMDLDEEFTASFVTLPSHSEVLHSPPEPIPTIAPSSAIPAHLDVPPDPIANGNVDQEGSELEATADDSLWKRFDILASAPHDHAFYASAPAQPSKNFLGRLTKEYRVLSSSLPGAQIQFFAHSGG
jgi:ubiquitin-conjugating enzyme E2 O